MSQFSKTADSVSSDSSVNGPLVMPFANVSHLGFAEMLQVTQMAGFGGLSLRPHDVIVIKNSGLGLQTARRMAADVGVEIVRLDPLSAWTTMLSSDDTNHAMPPVELFEFCQQLGCTYVSLNATFPVGHISKDQVIEDFARTCDLAAEFGVSCDLENLPMWGVQTLTDAWEIVKDADRANGGIVFDILHFVRGGSTLEDLAAVPGERIHTVQLNDGPLELPTDVSLLENCFNRLWPGEGQFPITEVLHVLARTGGLTQVNAEVFSPRNRELSAVEIAAKSSETLRAALSRAGLRPAEDLRKRQIG